MVRKSDARGNLARRIRRTGWILGAVVASMLTPATATWNAAVAGPVTGGAADEQPATLAAIRLGMLIPGGRTTATAIDGDIVVGKATVEYGPWTYDPTMDLRYRRSVEHAVVWDLTEPEPAALDLGTLGGQESYAVAVDGTWVVGNSQTEKTYSRAFAVNVADERPTMVNLAPEGTRSSATAVDDGIVVGSSYIGGSEQAFAIDLNAEHPQVMYLGNLGGWSKATAVRDGVVVGTAWTPDHEQRAFAVDLNSPNPTMRDLGNLGGPSHTHPTAVEGAVVVGTSSTPHVDGKAGEWQAFAVDRTDSAVNMRNISSGAAASSSTAVDIENGLVVGHEWQYKANRSFAFAYDVGTRSRTEVPLGTKGIVLDVDSSGSAVGIAWEGDSHWQAFEFDATAAAPKRMDLGALGGVAKTADQEILIGYKDDVAAAWPVGDTVGLRDAAVAVDESADAVSIRVFRTGDLSTPATISYTTVAGTARAQRDFAPVAGTATFAAGHGETTIRVPIDDDRRGEPRERFTLRLSDPSTGQRLLGTQTTIAIRPSDQRPDGEVSTSRHGGYVGDDVYNRTGRRQTKMRTVRRGDSARFFMRVHNDRKATITIAVRPHREPAGLRVRYFRGGRNITSKVTSSNGWKTRVKPGRSRVVRVKIAVKRSTPAGAIRILKVASVWSGDHTRRDVVRTRLRVRR